MVLNAAFPSESSWSKPELLAQALWKDSQSAILFAAVRNLIATMPDVVIGQRKSFTAFSRNVQFAAARPMKAGRMLLGLAITAGECPMLVASGHEGWSERLKSAIEITAPEQINPDLLTLVRKAWEQS